MDGLVDECEELLSMLIEQCTWSGHVSLVCFWNACLALRGLVNNKSPSFITHKHPRPTTTRKIHSSLSFCRFLSLYPSDFVIAQRFIWLRFLLFHGLISSRSIPSILVQSSRNLPMWSVVIPPTATLFSTPKNCVSMNISFTWVRSILSSNRRTTDGRCIFEMSVETVAMSMVTWFIIPVCSWPIANMWCKYIKKERLRDDLLCLVRWLWKRIVPIDFSVWRAYSAWSISMSGISKRISWARVRLPTSTERSPTSLRHDERSRSSTKINVKSKSDRAFPNISTEKC